MPIQWIIGSTPTITWTSLDILGNVQIQISRDNGNTWATITPNTANSGSYVWTVTGPATTVAVFKISGLIYTDPIDQSQTDFTGTFALSDVFSIVGISFFQVSPQRNSIPVISTVNISYLISLLSDSYFSTASDFSRIDVIYVDPNSRQRKAIIHMGPSFTGIASWSSYAIPGTWEKVKVRVRDTDGAVHFLCRTQIGSGEDIVLS
jgi:hypothetical protein